MNKVTNVFKNKCTDDFPCFYRKDNSCTFWEQAEAVPAAWEKVFPGDPDSDLRCIDTFIEPCLELDEKRRGSCARFIIPGEKGWLKCEDCRESLCSYMKEPFEVGDMLRWLRT